MFKFYLIHLTLVVHVSYYMTVVHVIPVLGTGYILDI